MLITDETVDISTTRIGLSYLGVVARRKLYACQLIVS